MIPLDPHDPFPLVIPALPYPEEQDHSRRVDDFLGFRCDETEKLIASLPGRQNWSGLPVQALQTPYLELRRMLHELAPPSHSLLIDLGCAYGRLAFVVGSHYPSLRFLGLELEPSRVREAQRVLAPFSYPHVEVRNQDLAQESVPPGDFYFLFDFGTKDEIRQVLEQLRVRARTRRFTVIGRGRATRDLIEQENPWLSQVIPPRHFPRYSFFSST